MRYVTRGFVPVVVTIVAIVVGFAWVLANKSGDAHHPNHFGQIAIPGSKTVALPSGSFDLILESDDTNVSADVPPALTASVAAATPGAAAPKLTRDVGGEYSLTGYVIINTPFDYHYRRVWTMAIPTSGSYLITTGPANYANPHNFLLDIGHAPGAGDLQIWGRVGIAWIALIALWIAARLTVAARRRRQHDASAGDSRL